MFSQRKRRFSPLLTRPLADGNHWIGASSERVEGVRSAVEWRPVPDVSPLAEMCIALLIRPDINHRFCRASKRAAFVVASVQR